MMIEYIWDKNQSMMNEYIRQYIFVEGLFFVKSK